MSTTILNAPSLRVVGAAPQNLPSYAARIWSWLLRRRRQSSVHRLARAAGSLHCAGRPTAARTVPLDAATNPFGFCVRHATELPVWAGDRLDRAYRPGR